PGQQPQRTRQQPRRVPRRARTRRSVQTRGLARIIAHPAMRPPPRSHRGSIVEHARKCAFAVPVPRNRLPLDPTSCLFGQEFLSEHWGPRCPDRKKVEMKGGLAYTNIIFARPLWAWCILVWSRRLRGTDGHVPPESYRRSRPARRG